MKIWFPTIRGYSGTDIFTRRLADALNRNGIEAIVSWFPTAYQFIPQLLKRINPPLGTNIIHANTWSAFAFKRSGIPLVVTEHQGVYSRKQRPYRSLAQGIYHTALIRRYVLASIRYAAAVTTVSNFTASGISQTLGWNSTRVIYNWVDTNLFAPASDTRRNNGKFRLLFMGNLGWLKGVDMLEPIMSRLGSGFELSIASGLKKQRIKETTGNMILHGSLTNEAEVIHAYQQCDAVIAPSRFEGFGYIPLEAMACGKPVIASDAGAIPEIVENKVTGILCPVGDVETFVSACRQLAAKPELAEEYGQAGRQRAENFFTEEKIIPQYMRLYRELVSAQPEAS